MKRLLALMSVFIFSSCNVVQLITGEETNVPDSFFQNSGVYIPERYIFFDCDLGNGQRPCMFSTETKTTVELSATLQNGKNHIGFKNNIVFAGYNGVNWGVYRYDLSNQTTHTIESGQGSAAFGFTQLGDYLYYASSANGGIRAVESVNWTPANIYNSATFVSNTYWVKASQKNGISKLYYCYNGGTYRIYELVLDSQSSPTSGSPSLVDPNGANTIVECNQKVFERDGLFVVTGTPNIVGIYDTSTNDITVYSIATANSLDGINIGFSGNFFFQKFDGADYDLYALDILDGGASPVLLLENDYNPNNLLNSYRSPTNKKYFFVDRDVNNQDQIFSISGPGGTLENETGFGTIGLSMLFITANKDNYYVPMSNGQLWILGPNTEFLNVSLFNNYFGAIPIDNVNL